MTDPMTDKGAAEAFTARAAWKPRRSFGHTERAVVIGFHSPHKGKPQCQGSILETGSNFTRRHQCSRVGKVTLADGSTWCGIHEPAAVAKRKAARAERDAERSAKRDAEMAAWKAERELKAAFPRFLAALREIEAGANDARAVAREALATYDP